jgi:Holliday junction resolvasome RuvABC endonuclease subunit
MLVMPPQATPLRVLGIDPGTTTLGVAALYWDIDNNKIHVDSAFTLQANDRLLGYQAITEVHGSRISRFYQQADELNAIFHNIRPHAVIAEAPYMGRFAQSFGALTECVLNIRQTLFNYDSSMPLLQVDPTTVKKTVGVHKGKMSDKEDVRRALRERTDISWGVDLELLDEHSVDAVAIAMYYLLVLV